MSAKMDNELEAMTVVLKALGPLSPDEQLRVVEWVTRKLALGAAPAKMPSSVNPASGFVGAAGPKQPLAVKSPKQFIADKRPKSDVERVACLGYYLTHFRETPEFKTRDITMLNREAAQPALGNPAMAVANAARVSQYLSSSGGGKKQLTSRGEALVESLPDRERVREALETFPLVGRKSKRSAGGRKRKEVVDQDT
jgi:hypothetical protein